jgi:NitT/TauT family transport system ATP-binding protein
MLLMDEPFAALDAQLRETMHQELLNTVSRLNESVLFVTHDISESILLSDRVLVLGGRPLRVLEETIIPWGKERKLDKIRGSDEYARLETHIRSLLRQADAEQYAATNATGAQ